MMKQISGAILLLFAVSVLVQGQNLSRKFGVITKDNLELTEYAPDKEAEAVVLFDMGRSLFVRSEGSFDVVFERTTRIKILSEAGIKWAEVEIPFYQEGNIFEKVYDIEACAYNAENGIMYQTPFEISNAFDERINNDWKVKKFAIPNVKEGTIIEYRYKISSQYTFNLRDWAFQWRIPVLHSEYEVKMIPFYEYRWILQGANRFDQHDSYTDRGNTRQFRSIKYHDMVHRYSMENVPAFNNEEFITSINDYIIKIDFQLAKINNPSGTTIDVLTTWEDMNKDLLKHSDFGKYIKKSEKLASKLLDVEGHHFENEKERFEFILDYVKGHYNWDSKNGKYASKSPRKFVEEKHGNCADINLFAIGLLRSYGIEAKPMLISTRENGKIKFDYPFVHFFNYVVIQANVDGVNILSDATESLALNNRIPSRCINDKGLIVQKDKVEWIGLECLFPSEIKTSIQIEIDNFNINSTVLVNATEYDALYYRNHYTDDTGLIKRRLETMGHTILDSTITVFNQTNKDKPYILRYNQQSQTEIVNNKIYLAPFLHEPISENPFKQNERTYPIDITYPKKRIFHSTILIPEGFAIDYLPSEHNIENELFSLSYSASVNENTISVSLEYHFKNSVYSSLNYSLIKSYYNEIVNKGNEKIVLSEKMEESNL